MSQQEYEIKFDCKIQHMNTRTDKIERERMYIEIPKRYHSLMRKFGKDDLTIRMTFKKIALTPVN